jgi:very-short-patch-repair endonuclease
MARDKSRKFDRGWRAVDFKSAQPTKSVRVIPLESICAEMLAGEDRDRIVSWVARCQVKLITTRQLNAAGMTSEAIALRCRKGLLHRIHHGVYLVGPLAWLAGGRELAATLAMGKSVFVSHGSGIRVHRVSDLPPDERARVNGIPVTSPARALLDYASQVRGDELEHAIAEAYALDLTTESQLYEMLERHSRRPGAGALKSELKRERGPALTRSQAERLMKRLLREADLPPPLTNHRVAGYNADFFWPQQRLIVEVDGYRFHSSRWAFERDRKRDAAHTLAGYRVIRITWRQLTEARLAVAATLAAALALG